MLCQNNYQKLQKMITKSYLLYDSSTKINYIFSLLLIYISHQDIFECLNF